MSTPTKREVAHAQRVVADPAFKLAFFMHSVLSHCYTRGVTREERHKIYEQAGIPTLLHRAERRAQKEEIMTNITAKQVFAARQVWLKKPCTRTSQAYQKLRQAYADRFPQRRLDMFNQRVEFLGIFAGGK